ncbi:MAG: hypothetical protein JO038_01375 [Alphaproteobacteria bacterium]|nr:hypothetical protein [Alphaproteobacteria bacterium]
MRRLLTLVPAALLSAALLTGSAQAGSTFPSSNTSNGGSIFNLDSTKLKNWRKALARVRAGTGRATLLIEGDSTTSGAGAGSSGTTDMVGARAKSVVPDLASILSKQYGLAVSDNSFIGDQGCYYVSGVALSAYDTRISYSSAFYLSSIGTLGGYLIGYGNAGAGTLSFTPAGAIDTIKILSVKNTGAGGGSFTVNVDGGSSLGTVTTTGSGAVGADTFTVTKGTHTINMVASNNGGFYFLGIIAFDSTTPAVDIIGVGNWGSVVSQHVGNIYGWDPLSVLKNNIVPDLDIINLTINDSNNNTGLAAYQTNMQTLITGVHAAGDVVLMAGAPSNTTQATNGTLDQYIGALASLASSNAVPLLNLKQRWQSYAAMNPVFPYYDSVHPGVLGYQDIAQSMAEVIARP